MKKLLESMICALTISLAGCGGAPDESHLIDGKSTLYGIGLNCAPRDQTCGTVFAFPLPLTWCGCTDYFSYSKPQTVKIKVGDKMEDVTWPGSDHLNALFPDNPVAQRMALDLELTAALYPDQLAAFKAKTQEEKLDLLIKTYKANPQAAIAVLLALKL